MITLEQILKAEFADANFDEITQELQKHSIYSPLSDALSIINTHLKNKQKEISTFGFIQLPHIAVCVLIRINEYLRYLDDEKRFKESEHLSYLCGSIFRRCLQLLISEMPPKAKVLFAKSLYIAMQDACTLYKYNFNQLIQIFTIIESADARAAIKSAPSILSVKPELVKQIPGYLWLSNEDKLEAFFKIFANQKICVDGELEKFKSLFNNPTQNLSINFNKGLVSSTLQFFYSLNSSNLISYYGCKGFYQVLQVHVVDFDSHFLQYKTPQRKIDSLRNHITWKSNKKKFSNLLKTLS